MECRLCLRSAPVESSVSIHDYPHPLVQRILACCQLQVNRDDLLPDTICLLCKNNLGLLSNFRSICIQSEETQKLRLTEILNIKNEETILDDLIWEDEIGNNSTSNVCQPGVDDEINESESSNSGKQFLEGDYSKQNALLIENDNILEGKSSQENPHRCQICSILFTTKTSLMEHMNSHTGIKPYRCKVCLISFAHRSSLSRHAITHTKEKRFKCEICLKSFAIKHNFLVHMNSHKGIKPYECDVCLISFTYRSNLNRHAKTHTEERRFKCEMCSKLFTAKDSLVEHMNSHKEIKPNQCGVCLMSFTHRSTLSKHVKTHTKERQLK
ncbi:uncharacterized protein LOC143913033 isoform X1 [Arctopsyche grandis]|uniref:uncharacterized protein LOC143913033 isoform X1 n=1 Tax=Arctopsyche grandis TaxID=121162 RepID=UPI00406D7FB7